MTDREELEAKILRQMREIKDRLKKEGTSVPYDKENAQAAIDSFLENHPDKDAFLERLKNRMNQ